MLTPADFDHGACSFITFKTRIFAGPYFPAFGLNTESYSVSLLFSSTAGKSASKIITNTDNFDAVSRKKLFCK